MHGGLKGGVVLRREGEMKFCGDGIDFFEDGVAVELDSLHDRLVSSGLDRPSRNGEKGRPGSDAGSGISWRDAVMLRNQSKVELE